MDRRALRVHAAVFFVCALSWANEEEREREGVYCKGLVGSLAGLMSEWVRERERKVCVCVCVCVSVCVLLTVCKQGGPTTTTTTTKKKKKPNVSLMFAFISGCA